MPATTPPKVGDRIVTTIYGRPELVEVLAVRAFGALDVERLSDGRCFRLS